MVILRNNDSCQTSSPERLGKEFIFSRFLEIFEIIL